jgi:Flp pilus assembly protein TadG
MRSRILSDEDSRFGMCRRPAPSRTLRRGAATIELAIVLPLLITVLLGATDFGRVSYSSIAIVNAARSGAEYGSMNPYSSSTSTSWQTGVTQAVTNELSQSTVFDINKLTVTASSVTDSSGFPLVTVQVTYPFKTIVNWTFIPSSFNVQKSVVMRGIR